MIFSLQKLGKTIIVLTLSVPELFEMQPRRKTVDDFVTILNSSKGVRAFTQVVANASSG